MSQYARGKIRAFAKFSKAERTAELALLEAAVHWRNRLIHSGSSARFTSELRNDLLAHAAEFDAEYRHLDPEQMIERFGTREGSPSLKEIAGMITATHRFIRRVDSAILGNLDYDQYLKEIVRRHLEDHSRDEAQNRANRIWGRTERRAYNAIVTLARQNGFTDAPEHASRGLSVATIERLAGLSVREAIAAFRPM